MSEYDFQPGGSLKLKGVIDGSVKKRKKKSSKLREKDKGDIARSRLQETGSKTIDGSGTSMLMEPELPVAAVNKTEAEKRFEAAQRERLEKKISKVATKTHKERVNEFNNKLEALSEHHDIPKVGPG